MKTIKLNYTQYKLLLNKYKDNIGNLDVFTLISFFDYWFSTKEVYEGSTLNPLLDSGNGGYLELDSRAIDLFTFNIEYINKVVIPIYSNTELEEEELYPY